MGFGILGKGKGSMTQWPSVCLLKEITRCAIIKPHCSRIRPLSPTVRGMRVFERSLNSTVRGICRAGYLWAPLFEGFGCLRGLQALLFEGRGVRTAFKPHCSRKQPRVHWIITNRKHNIPAFQNNILQMYSQPKNQNPDTSTHEYVNRSQTSNMPTTVFQKTKEHNVPTFQNQT